MRVQQHVAHPLAGYYALACPGVMPLMPCTAPATAPQDALRLWPKPLPTPGTAPLQQESVIMTKPKKTMFLPFNHTTGAIGERVLIERKLQGKKVLCSRYPLSGVSMQQLAERLLPFALRLPATDVGGQPIADNFPTNGSVNVFGSALISYSLQELQSLLQHACAANKEVRLFCIGPFAEESVIGLKPHHFWYLHNRREDGGLFIDMPHANSACDRVTEIDWRKLYEVCFDGGTWSGCHFVELACRGRTIHVPRLLSALPPGWNPVANLNNLLSSPGLLQRALFKQRVVLATHVDNPGVVLELDLSRCSDEHGRQRHWKSPDVFFLGCSPQARRLGFNVRQADIDGGNQSSQMREYMLAVKDYYTSLRA